MDAWEPELKRVIGLQDLDSKIGNFALEKVRIFYQERKYSVEDYVPGTQYEEVWCSSIFDFTDKSSVAPGAIRGGTGFDLTTILPREIDSIIPRLNYGFTTRGCIRNCKFCVVRRKEGPIRVVGDLLDLWDGRAREISIFDNNILGLPEHFKLVCGQAKENHLRIDFNQGLDHRLLTPGVVEILRSTPRSVPTWKFAFDSVKSFPSVERALSLLQSGGIPRAMWYVLVGFDSTFKEDLERLNYLRSRNQVAYVQRFHDPKAEPDRRLTALARWVNQRHIFRGMTWEQFIATPKNLQAYGKFDWGVYQPPARRASEDMEHQV